MPDLSSEKNSPRSARCTTPEDPKAVDTWRKKAKELTHPVDMVKSRNALCLRDTLIRGCDASHLSTQNIPSLCYPVPEREDTAAFAEVEWRVKVESIHRDWDEDIHNIYFPNVAGTGPRVARIPCTYDSHERTVLFPRLFVPIQWTLTRHPVLENVLRWRPNRRPWKFRMKVTVTLKYEICRSISPWGNNIVRDYDDPDMELVSAEDLTAMGYSGF